jgi:hypothetical protein
MAGTAGFFFKKNLDGVAYTPSLLSMMGKNSVTFTVGDVIRINTSGNLDLSTANEQVVGIVSTVTDANGKAKDPDSGTTNTWTMDSDNVTVAADLVHFTPTFAHYAFAADSDTTITTADLGKYFNVVSTSDGIITSGESYTIGTLMFQCIGVDPLDNGDVSWGLYRCVASQMGQITQADGAA